MPLLVVTPLRALYSPDIGPIAVVLLGPAFEESLKLAGVILALTIASVTLRGGRDPGLALRYWLFLVPWLVGGLDGMVEGVLVYPGQGATDFALREIAHGAFVALSVAGALGIWQRTSAPLFGIGFGFGVGFAAHIWFNALALLADLGHSDHGYQTLYLALVFALALSLLARAVRREPASEETRAFLPAPGTRVQP